MIKPGIASNITGPTDFPNAINTSGISMRCARGKRSCAPECGTGSRFWNPLLADIAVALDERRAGVVDHRRDEAPDDDVDRQIGQEFLELGVEQERVDRTDGDHEDTHRDVIQSCPTRDRR
jgi:hypothetical protein